MHAFLLLPLFLAPARLFHADLAALYSRRSFSFWSWLLSGLLAPGSWLLAPCSWLLFLPSPTSFHPFHLLLYNTIRHDTTGHCEDTLVPSSSLLYSLPFITASFVFCPSLSLPCFFLLCLSPVQPPPGPILILETRVVETARSSSPPLARLLVATPARHHDREAPRRHQQQNTTHPNPPATTAACHPLSSHPVRFAPEATSFLSASSLCACYYRASPALSSLRPLRARHVRLLGPFVPRLASSPTKACISRHSAPLSARADLPLQPIPPPATFTLVLGPSQAHDASDLTEAPHVLALASHHRVHAWDS